MTNEEAVVILKNAIKKPNTKDGYLGQALAMAIKALEKNIQPEICPITNGVCGYPIEDCCNCPNIQAVGEQKRWIPVTERLPENEQKVLFCTKQGNIHQGTYYIDSSKWYSNIRSSWIYFDSILVWMPLPEPYKAESEGEE